MNNLDELPYFQETRKYSSNSKSENVLKGRIALTKKGIDFCLDQLLYALKLFRQIKVCDDAHLEEQLQQLAQDFEEEISDQEENISDDESEDEDSIDESY